MTRLPRTLTDVLRTRDSDQLTDLIRSRNDLGYPLPRDIADLASQANTSTSVQRAIETLNAWQATVLKALAVLPDPAGLAGIADLLGAAEQPVAAGVATLRQIAVVWGDDQHLHLVRAARDHFGNYPGGLAPPSPHPLTAEQIDAAISACGTDVMPILERLTWGPPTGTVSDADREVTVATARTPVEKLLARRLLRPLSRDTVVLAQEVALRLRSQASDWLLDGEPVSPDPPQPNGPVRSQRTTTLAAVGAAHELTHDLEQLIAGIDADPPRLLRDGSVPVRELQEHSRSFNGRTDYTGFLLECGAAASLVNSREQSTLLPTPEWDRWRTADAVQRWQLIASGWRDGQRWFGRPEQGPDHDHHDSDGEPEQETGRKNRRKTDRPLGHDDHAPQAPRLRTVIIRIAASAPAGTVVDLDYLTAAVGWELPVAARDPDRLRQMIALTWQQAEWLGLVALGGTTRLLPVLAGEADMRADLTRLFPEPVGQVIIQSDLTAVAQGPLESGVAEVLRLLADQESRGGGAVFRFSQSSLRRGFDAGWSSTEISEWLTAHSTTGVPQPLAYMVEDVARQHGAIRVGGMSSYLRIEDPAQQAAVVSHPDAARLQLRGIAPGVLVSPADPDEVVALLRQLGLQPAAEDEHGSLLTTRPRRRARTPREDTDDRPQVDPRQAAEAILAAENRLPPANDISYQVGFLQQAAETGRVIRVSLVDSQGHAREHDIVVLSVGDGTVRAQHVGSATVSTMPMWQLTVLNSDDASH